MADSKQDWLDRLYKLGGAVGGFATLGALIFALWPWPFADSNSREGTQETAVSVDAEAQGEASPEVGPQEPASGQSSTLSGTRPSEPSEPPEPREAPLELTLSDGEQKVVLGGEVGLAARFTQLGEALVPTLQVDADGPAAGSHALWGDAPRSFELRAAGRDYVVRALRVDTAARTLTVAVHPK